MELVLLLAAVWQIGLDPFLTASGCVVSSTKFFWEIFLENTLTFGLVFFERLSCAETNRFSLSLQNLNTRDLHTFSHFVLFSLTICVYFYTNRTPSATNQKPKTPAESQK